MKLVIVALMLSAATAHADEARCAAGKALATTGDLPRAALYLDSCTDDEGIRVRNDVVHELEGTQLSHLTISSLPDGQVGETDALPGETFTTPATIWAKAGTYKVTVGGQTVEKTIEPHSRTTVIINVPAPARPAKAGSVSFEDDPEQHQGAPPAVKHGSMLPDRYRKRSAAAGEQLDDPMAAHDTPADARWRFGVRLAGGVADHAGAIARASIGLAVTAARPLAGPASLRWRIDWSHRGIDTFGANVGFGLLALRRPQFALSAGLAVRGGIHAQSRLDGMPVDRVSLGGAAELSVALRSLPLVFGVRAEQALTDLVPGAREHVLLAELGYDWR